ncbi:MAG: hypothetical protein K8R68_12080 [Bacteroidales bacterium]|nr:hypothetical protein [Bacteroidales bacterium]
MEYLYNGLSSLIGILIGSAVIIWYKNKEYKLKLLELKELKTQHKLNISKLKHEQLLKILDFGLGEGYNNERTIALKRFAKILNIVENYSDFEDEFNWDYKSKLAFNILSSLDYIIDQLEKFNVDFPQLYNNLRDEINIIIKEARRLIDEIDDYEGFSTPADQTAVFHSKDLLELYNNMKIIRSKMTSEFEELEKLRQEYFDSIRENN